MVPKLSQHAIAATTAMVLAASSATAEAQEKRYTLGSLAEGTTPFLVNTAWANAVNKYVPGHKIQVSAVGAATRHMILVLGLIRMIHTGIPSAFNMVEKTAIPGIGNFVFVDPE